MANGRRSKTRAFADQVFAQQKSRMGLFVRTVGIARARTKDRHAQPCLQSHPRRLARGLRKHNGKCGETADAMLKQISHPPRRGAKTLS